jgi:hypothetical protein
VVKIRRHPLGLLDVLLYFDDEPSTVSKTCIEVRCSAVPNGGRKPDGGPTLRKCPAGGHQGGA